MTAQISWSIKPPTRAQFHAVLALFPRLASFELPPERNPDHLWQGDAAMLERWFAGQAPDVHVLIATNPASDVAGVAMFSLRPELLSQTPSAHLEALAVAAPFEGRGVGTALLDASHALARELGAQSMTLHVFHTNQRALALYQRRGYVPELHRCIKWFDQ